MKSIREMSLGELAAYICDYLNRNDIKCILTGGACVSIYTDNKYQSDDLDFIEYISSTRQELKTLLAGIGFQEKDRYFVHKETRFWIEFPSGPLSVGSEPINNFNEIEYETGKLFLLTPTDCVKDRLAAFYHWDDKQALQQAIWVAKNQSVNFNEIRRWSEAENQAEKFKSIKDRLKK